MNTLSSKKLLRKYYFKAFCKYNKSLVIPLCLVFFILGGICLYKGESWFTFSITVIVPMILAILITGLHFHVEIKPMVKVVLVEAIEEWNQESLNIEYASLQSKFNRTF